MIIKQAFAGQLHYFTHPKAPLVLHARGKVVPK
jgi:hypothetical protein